MSREIRFRVFDKKDGKMKDHDWLSAANVSWFHVFHTERTDIVVMQFTGLKDKNGKEIYEGDICWTYEIGLGNLKRVVVFDGGSFCLKHDFALTSELRGWKADYIEVIGNQYQNPELL